MSSKDLMPSDEGTSNSGSSGPEYEVFLSFRGPDTRNGFTDYLYTGLCNAGIRVYRDEEELRSGEEIGTGLLKGIEKSKIAIPIVSKDYASSKWCLKELAEIMKWKQSKGMNVKPIFYYVAPSEVRNQTGDYGKAFESHEKYYDEKTIREWREALSQVGQLKGWEIQKDKNSREGKLVDEVIKVVLRELKKGYKFVTDNLIGVEHHVEAILNMIASEANDVRIVGIYGMGGIGKTTLAKVIYNDLLSRYETCSFLADIRSKSIEFLQKKMISDLSQKKWTDIADIDDAILIIRERFVEKKVLILLDDVDQRSQLEGLVRKREWFGPGSRIIMTTRNKSILDTIEVDRSYELSFMDSQQALQLFSRHAFRTDGPPEEFTFLSQKAVEITQGLPLAVEVIGSLLCGKDKKAWDSKLQMLEKIPNEKVCTKLQISFDSLNYQQQQVFLDIACFFIGADTRTVIHFWNDGELFPHEAIEVLEQMSLIKIQKDNSIWMHDQLRDMGRDIVRQEHIEPEKRSRLWNQEEATNSFKKKMGHENVRGICLDFGKQKQYHFPSEDLALLPNLRFLRIRGDMYITSKRRNFFKNWFPWKNSSFSPYKSSPIFSKLRWLSWHGFPPTNKTIIFFSLENWVILDLSWSGIQTGWWGWRYVKMAKKLRVLNLTGCRRLVKTPDLSSHPLLEQLILQGCNNLVEIDESISMLKKLVIIDLDCCRRLRKLPKKLSCMKSLEELRISGSSILEIPDWPSMERLIVFNCSGCCSLKKVSSLNFTSLVKLSFAYCREVRTLPQSIGNLVSLKELNLFASGIVELPRSIGNLVSLEVLQLSLSKIVELPGTIGNLKNLINLNVGWTPIRELPATIRMMENLLSLDASGCFYLIDLPEFPQSLISLKAPTIKLERIPDLLSLIHLRNLELICAGGSWDLSDAGSLTSWCSRSLTSWETLGFPQGISVSSDMGILSHVKKLELSGCHNLLSIPELPSSLTRLWIVNCGSLETLLNLPPGLTQLRISFCSSLRTLSNLPPGLTQLRISSCSSLRTLSNLPSGLTSLCISGCDQLRMLPDLSNLSKLKSFQLSGCPNLVEILGRLESLDFCLIHHCKSLTLLNLPSGLRILSINGCHSLEASMDLSYMRQLDDLQINHTSISKLEGLSSCKSLRHLMIGNCGFFEIEGLETLESLTYLYISGCDQLRRLPDLSNLSKLKDLRVSDCPSLVEILGRLESLDSCHIRDCESLTRIPDIPNFRNTRNFSISECRKLRHELRRKGYYSRCF